MLSATELAIYQTVHEYPGGATALARFLACSPGTLSNKANPAQPQAHLTVQEALALMLATGDYRILQALAQEAGHAVVRVGDFSDTSDLDLLSAWSAMQVEAGETAAAIHEALEDGDISPEEYARIEREAFEDFSATFELLARLKALVR